MPRVRRFEIARLPQHVIQRGNNRTACFFEPVDCQRYLVYLREFSLEFGCAVHAYVLMTNHVHLLVTPSELGAVSHLMHAIGSSYVPYVNRRQGRSGTLWQGRYKSCVVNNDRYLLTCYRYIEQNPQRASMVADAGDYPWSSYACNALGRFDPVVTPHDVYLALGPNAEDRARAYREIVGRAVDGEDLTEIRTFMQRGRTLG